MLTWNVDLECIALRGEPQVQSASRLDVGAPWPLSTLEAVSSSSDILVAGSGLGEFAASGLSPVTLQPTSTDSRT